MRAHGLATLLVMIRNSARVALLVAFVVLLSTAGCADDGSTGSQDTSIGPYWVAIVDSSASSNDLEFEVEVTRLRQLVGERSFGSEVVVSPVRCFPELVESYLGDETDYVLALKATEKERVESLIELVGSDNGLNPVSSTDICVG